MGKPTLVLKLAFGFLILTIPAQKCHAGLEATEVRKIEVVSSGLNIRLGAGINHEAVAQAVKGDILEVIGSEKGWYLVRTRDGVYGMVYNEYTKIAEVEKAAEIGLPQGADDSFEEENDLEKAFAIVNEARKANNLTPFEWSDELNLVAMAKASDMAENNYFSHNSPIYGTPFKMLKTFEVEYSTASENLARDASIENAFKEMMASPAHRGNILNSRFTKTGIGICDSPIYGKIIVQIFVG